MNGSRSGAGGGCRLWAVGGAHRRRDARDCRLVAPYDRRARRSVGGVSADHGPPTGLRRQRQVAARGKLPVPHEPGCRLSRSRAYRCTRSPRWDLPLAHAARGALGGTTALVGAGLLVTSVVGLVATRPSPPSASRSSRLGSRSSVGRHGLRTPRSPGRLWPRSTNLAELRLIGGERNALRSTPRPRGPWTVPSVRVLLRRDGRSARA